MKERDYYLLQWIGTFNNPTTVEEKNAPQNVREKFTFFGLDRNKYPNSIHTALFDLEQIGLVKNSSYKFAITDTGRQKLESYLQNIKKEEEKENLRLENMNVDLQKTNLEITHLVDTILDYDKRKRNTVLAIVFAAISAIAALIALLKK